ncbi:E3 ubiquitin-protein ligase RHA2A [Elaeis guineensis]|uniref:E3 ubiquitin-protein ligase RHA2A n=1 Tax=Elaeis guineensis var. tenera TaxID=51953 RepID=A0A6I9S4G7_ELAGV|nr:E3 ubiquitin-protein ligase RHA2A [Elaeis guineensis]
MGLSNRLHDVSSDSIPILLLVTAAEWVAYLRSLLLCLLHSLGLLRLHPSSAVADDPLFPAAGSGLAGLVVIASSTRSFIYEAPPSAEKEEVDCVVCLCGLADGDRVRRLACCHVFHSKCLDGWFDQMNLSCPLCRSPLVAAERRADADRRIGAELVAWLSPYRSDQLPIGRR